VVGLFREAGSGFWAIGGFGPDLGTLLSGGDFRVESTELCRCFKGCFTAELSENVAPRVSFAAVLGGDRGFGAATAAAFEVRTSGGDWILGGDLMSVGLWPLGGDVRSFVTLAGFGGLVGLVASNFGGDLVVGDCAGGDLTGGDDLEVLGGVGGLEETLVFGGEGAFGGVAAFGGEATFDGGDFTSEGGFVFGEERSSVLADDFGTLVSLLTLAAPVLTGRFPSTVFPVESDAVLGFAARVAGFCSCRFGGLIFGRIVGFFAAGFALPSSFPFSATVPFMTCRLCKT